jgi:hypothetical protein
MPRDRRQREHRSRDGRNWQATIAKVVTVLGSLGGLSLGVIGLSHNNATLEAFAANLFIGVPLLTAQFSRSRDDEDDDR